MWWIWKYLKAAWAVVWEIWVPQRRPEVSPPVSLPFWIQKWSMSWKFHLSMTEKFPESHDWSRYIHQVWLCSDLHRMSCCYVLSSFHKRKLEWISLWHSGVLTTSCFSNNLHSKENKAIMCENKAHNADVNVWLVGLFALNYILCAAEYWTHL